MVGTSVVKMIDQDGNLVTKPIDRSLITANRVNLSYWARAMGLGGDGEDDLWLRVRNYPAIAMAGAFVLVRVRRAAVWAGGGNRELRANGDRPGLRFLFPGRGGEDSRQAADGVCGGWMAGALGEW